MDFYPGAHGLCRLFARIFDTTSDQVAGIYAALSPMNGWYTNVANVLDVLRHGRQFASSVNTTDINHWKALAILHGTDPLTALGRGKKVRAFYRGISTPDDLSPIPVDRHLICLALGRKITSNQDLRSIAGSSEIYTKVEAAYTYLGDREGIGNRLASIAWFVQRRVRGEQKPIPHPQSPICCDKPMHSHGHKPRRFRCNQCGVTSTRRGDISPPLFYVDSYPVRADSRGRHRIHLGKFMGSTHPYANSGGWQYLSRYLIMKQISRKLRSDEHAHHSNLDKTDDRIDNYELLAATYHGRLHGLATVIGRPRSENGRFIELDEPDPTFSWPRHRAMLGPAAKESG